MNSELPRPHEHVVSTEFEHGEGVLVDLNTKRYFQLNETAMVVWRGLGKGSSRQEIAGELARLYEVSHEHASRSVDTLLENFRAYKLVGQRE